MQGVFVDYTELMKILQDQGNEGVGQILQNLEQSQF